MLFSTQFRASQVVRLCDKARNFISKGLEIQRCGNFYKFLINGKSLQTPLGNTLQTTHPRIAQHVLSELLSRANDPLLRFACIPITMLLAECLDAPSSLEIHKREHIQELLDFDVLLNFELDELTQPLGLESLSQLDKLGYIKDMKLKTLQTSCFLPLLHKFKNVYNVPMPIYNISLSRPQQPDEIVNALQQCMQKYPIWKCILIRRVQAHLRSIILAMLVLEGHVDPKEAVRNSRLEETYQAAKWGVTTEFRETERQLDALLRAARLLHALLNDLEH
ncbi:bifunctional ATP12 orthogonal Bundle domain superfamily/ATP12 [Babesia duncani]|uniref:Bifunctional ATP12 orthogonal Bundle domain superfamily/ATP12 n=1 Tax=Babesia duncani TaxID=323732 RepID=A0AAD9UQH5_9APIC|nr:bifunctional ATP12 orthogonal Bundle domain superfamily/ATP12 [Babesia duncani]